MNGSASALYKRPTNIGDATAVFPSAPDGPSIYSSRMGVGLEGCSNRGEVPLCVSDLPMQLWIQAILSDFEIMEKYLASKEQVPKAGYIWLASSCILYRVPTFYLFYKCRKQNLWSLMCQCKCHSFQYGCVSSGSRIQLEMTSNIDLKYLYFQKQFKWISDISAWFLHWAQKVNQRLHTCNMLKEPLHALAAILHLALIKQWDTPQRTCNSLSISVSPSLWLIYNFTARTVSDILTITQYDELRTWKKILENSRATWKAHLSSIWGFPLRSRWLHFFTRYWGSQKEKGQYN